MLTLGIGQTELMMIFSGICLMISFVTIFLKFENKVSKYSLIIMGVCSFALLQFNRLAWVYSGVVTDLAFTITRISYFAVLLLMLVEVVIYNCFLTGIIVEDENQKAIPIRLYFSGLLPVAGVVMLIINQFTGFIYSINEENLYVRGSGMFSISILFLAVVILQLSVIITCNTRLRKMAQYALMTYTLLLIVGAIIQFLNTGLSINTFSFAWFGIILYICAVYDNSKKLDEARKREVEALEGQKQILSKVLVETSGALAQAIDAKDRYTNGHSKRVAEYSREIARRAGYDEDTCNRIYFAGLLHDVGKIGIPDDIINKPSRLTDEEFALIKDHPSIGANILSNITTLPYLQECALYHHERYDGKGYPTHLKGEEIPEFSRIIALADSYDAMTSNRSYRNQIPQETVRAEIEKGMGTQFDPTYAKYLLQMIDEDKNYDMREKI